MHIILTVADRYLRNAIPITLQKYEKYRKYLE